MKNKLAIDGGKRVFEELPILPSWPPVIPSVAEDLKNVYLSGKWSFNGPTEQQFAQDFAKFHTADFGVVMSNGTVTLESALNALNIGTGDEVIVPALTWVATAMAVIYTGATPVFVDIESDTWCLDPLKLEEAITPRTKAIIPVHLYGSMADMEKIMHLAEERNLYVIEDCAHAHGGIWNGKGIGSIGHIGSFSFQQSKTMCSGEGGICLTNDKKLADRLYRIKHIGYPRDVPQGQVAEPIPEGLICHNYRCTEFQAAILAGGLKLLEKQTATRAGNVDYLEERLKDIPGVKSQAKGRLANRQGYYSLGFNIDTAVMGDTVTVDGFIEALVAEGASCNRTYGLVYNHWLWNMPAGMFRKMDCSVADKICRTSLMFNQVGLAK